MKSDDISGDISRSLKVRERFRLSHRVLESHAGSSDLVVRCCCKFTVSYRFNERLAEARNGFDAKRTHLLQSVHTGKAQEAFSAVSVTDCGKSRYRKDIGSGSDQSGKRNPIHN